MTGNNGHSAKPGGNGNAIVTRAFGDTAEKHANSAVSATNVQVNCRSVAEGTDEETKTNDEDNDGHDADENLCADNGMVDRGK